MKPLNRPMFRYGGPIKEGVMSGIREPRKDGGFMSQLVKPNNDGSRPGYAGPLAIPAFMGLNALRTGAMALGRRAIPKIANFFRTKTGEIGAGTAKVRTLPPMTAGRNLSKNIKTVPKQGPGQPIYEPNYLGRDPLVRAAGGLYNTITSPTAKGIGAKAVRFATSPSSIIAGTAYYLWPDGKERTTPPPLGDSGRRGTSGAPGGGDPGMFLTPQGDASKKGGGVELSAEERRAKNVERYRDIMDIKGMNKDAAYNSLIAASQAINESGDFKGDIKSGKLINQIIQATSKQFDKPKATKDAIDTLILKGEIEKDINASDPKSIADLAYKQAATQKLNKELKGNSTAEIIQARMLKDDMPSGSNLASLISINNPELNIKTLPTKDLGNADPIDYMTQIVATVNADETTPDYPAGVYVLKDKVIQITEEGSVIPVPINALK